MCIDTSVDVDMRAGMCVGMCVNVGVDMCVAMYVCMYVNVSVRCVYRHWRIHEPLVAMLCRLDRHKNACCEAFSGRPFSAV